ncbi:MAG TPA: hypothetical protein PKH77_21295 [Anaerolineae bacterium]|nr:hypothetical protein [Anaerolineae bacterium]
MSATPTQIKTALATVLAAITGVRRVYTTAPNSLPPSDLPAWVIYTGPATYAVRGYGIYDGETRRYTLRLYVLPLQEGIPGEAEAACEPFFTRVRAALDPDNRLNQLVGILELTLLGDQGVSVLNLGGSAYLGIEFTLEVTQ